MTSDEVFLYGECVKKAFETYKHRFSANTFAIGSSCLDRLKVLNGSPRKKQPKKIGRFINILYATTNYYQNLWYAGISPPFSDCYFFQDGFFIMEALQRLLENNYNIKATVKLHPSRLLEDPPWLEKFSGVKNIKFIKDKPKFVKLLQLSDVILIDLPSTIVLQSVSTNLPVFVLMRHWNYTHYARTILEKRAVCADDVKTLIDNLCKYLDSGIYQADINDDSFIKGYGTFLNDGKSAERAAGEVLEMIGKKVISVINS